MGDSLKDILKKECAELTFEAYASEGDCSSTASIFVFVALMAALFTF